jgi:hypothetical protein
MAMTRRTHLLAVFTAWLAVSVVLSAMAPAAWAHPGLVTDTAVAESTPPAPALPVAAAAPASLISAASVPTLSLESVGLVLALGLVLAVRRRTVATALVPILVVLAIETGVHSVHHLADQQKNDSTCAVALASAHVHGAAEPPATVHDLWLAVPAGTVVPPAPERPGARSLRPDEGRAPPAA